MLASGMLALERSENVYRRLIRGLVSPGSLLVEKIILAAVCGALVSFAMVVGILVGTYSTIYIASPIVLWMERTPSRR
jgi:preprotein translocase subunit SecF